MILLARGSEGSAIKPPSASDFFLSFLSFLFMLLRNHQVEVSSLTNGVDLSGPVVHTFGKGMLPAGYVSRKVQQRGLEGFGTIFLSPFATCLQGKSPLAQSPSFHQILVLDQRLENSDNTVHHLASGSTRRKPGNLVACLV